MRLRYDEDFVEAAVFLCATGARAGIPSLQVARFHREREKLYSVLDPDDRNRAFFQLHLEWFREWGLEKLLIEPLPGFPLLAAALNVLAFRVSRGGNDDGADLYVNESGERNGVVAMHPKRLVQDVHRLPFLLHELMHLNDMVDPAFGYQPELPALSPSLGSQRLARDRYRLLWAVSIDGRLSRNGRPAPASKDERWSEFADAFPFWTEDRQRQVFDSLWSGANPTHRSLVEWIRGARKLESASGPRPGAPCPLCGFPTFAWADAAAFPKDTVATIQSEFPHWAPEHGACARCLAVYRLRNAPTLRRSNAPTPSVV